MRTASEILDSINAAGAALVVEAGKARVRGAQLPQELLAELKASRTEVLAELERRQAADQDRYGRVPDERAERVGAFVALSEADRQEVVGYVMRQPRSLHAWVMGRANEYHADQTPVDECETRACLDVLAWQRNEGVGAAVEWLRGMGESGKRKAESGNYEKEK
jgi:hypothetical protein